MRPILAASLGWTLWVLASAVEISLAQQSLPVNKPTQVQNSTNAVNNNILPTGAPAANSRTAAQGPMAPNETEARRFEEYKRSHLYLEPFESNVLSLPDEQLVFVRSAAKFDFAFYREILYEAINLRNKMAANVRLVLKYGGRILANIIKHRREEKQLAHKVEPSKEFYNMVADIAQTIADQSNQLKRNYSKKKLDVEGFRLRVEALFDYVEQTIAASPMGGYMRWNQLVLFRDKAQNGIQNKPYVEELADLVAQFRVMGYETANFVIRRVVNLLRMFSRGLLPSSEKEVA